MTSGGAKHTEYSEKSKQEDGLIAKNFKFWSNIEWIKKYLCAVHKKSPRAILYSMEQWTHPRRLRNFRTCESALIKLDMESLAERREVLCLQFATKCTTNPKWSISLKQIMKYIQCRQDLKNCMKYSMQILEGCRTLL